MEKGGRRDRECAACGRGGDVYSQIGRPDSLMGCDVEWKELGGGGGLRGQGTDKLKIDGGGEYRGWRERGEIN